RTCWALGGSRSAEALTGADRDVEPVLGRGKRTRPTGIERARRLIGEVEVQDERAAAWVASEVGALGGIEEIAPGGVRLVPVGRVAERQEQPARVALHPEQREAAGSGRKWHLQPADPAKA